MVRIDMHVFHLSDWHEITVISIVTAFLDYREEGELKKANYLQLRMDGSWKIGWVTHQSNHCHSRSMTPQYHRLIRRTPLPTAARQ